MKAGWRYSTSKCIFVLILFLNILDSFLPSGTWGTICDDRWDLRHAQVVCQQLGYPAAATYRTAAFYREGRGPIWMDEVKMSHGWKIACLSNGVQQTAFTGEMRGWSVVRQLWFTWALRHNEYPVGTCLRLSVTVMVM